MFNSTNSSMLTELSVNQDVPKDMEYSTLPGFPTGFFTGLTRLYFSMSHFLFKEPSSEQYAHFMYEQEAHTFPGQYAHLLLEQYAPFIESEKLLFLHQSESFNHVSCSRLQGTHQTSMWNKSESYEDRPFLELHQRWRQACKSAV